MTAALADFIASPDGRLYRSVCANYGIDPGAVFDDEALAFQMRAGLMYAANVEPQPVEVPAWRRDWVDP